MVDLLREIDEELQRERMLAVWTKHKRLVIGLVLLVVLGTASYSAWQEHQSNTHFARSAGLFDIVARRGQSDSDKIEALNAFARDAAGTGHAAMAKFHVARLQLHAKNPTGAIATFDALAQDQTLTDAVRNYAALLAAQTQLESGNLAAAKPKLEALAAPGQPWRSSAQALLGFTYGKQGDKAKALAIFQALAEDDDTPQGLRDQAHDLAQFYATQS